MNAVATILIVVVALGLAPVATQADPAHDTAPPDEAYLREALGKLAGGNYHEVCRDLTRLHEEDPDDPALQYLLGLCNMIKGGWLLEGLYNRDTPGVAQEYRERAIGFEHIIAAFRARVNALHFPSGPARGGTVPWIAYDELPAMEWWRVSNLVTTSPSGRHVVWNHVRNRSHSDGRHVKAVDLELGADLTPLLAHLGSASVPMWFLPGSDEILVLDRSGSLGDRARQEFWHLPSRSRIGRLDTMGAKRGRTSGGYVAAPGDEVRRGFHSLHALPGGRHVLLTRGRKLWVVRSVVSSLSEVTEWLKGREEGSFVVKFGSLDISEHLAGEWRVSPLLYGMLVSSDGSFLLVPMSKVIPSGEIALCYALVDLTAAQYPVLRGLVPDWLTEQRYNAIHQTYVRVADKRVYAADMVPVYGGGRMILEAEPQSMDTSTSVTDVRVHDIITGAVGPRLGRARLFFPYSRISRPGSSGGGGGGVRTIRIVR